MDAITVSYICPPIPTRNYDFCAYFEDRGPEYLQGFGPTEQDAVNDLLEQHEEKQQ